MDTLEEQNTHGQTPGVHLSISQRLHESLAKIITSAAHDERLPSEPELARRLGVSRATLREAMRTFETQGLLRRRQGSGTYVVHPAHVIETGLEVLESIETLANRIGLQVSMGELECEQRAVNEEEARALSLEPGRDILHLSRVIQAEGRAVAFLVDILPSDVLSASDLQDDFTGSVLDLLLRQNNLDLAVSRTEINATTANSEVARKMGIQRGDVLLRFVAHLYTTNGKVIDHSFSYFLPGYFRFQVIRRVG